MFPQDPLSTNPYQGVPALPKIAPISPIQGAPPLRAQQPAYAPPPPTTPFPTPPRSPTAGQSIMGPGGPMGDMIRQGVIQSMLYGNPYGLPGSGGAIGQALNPQTDSGVSSTVTPTALKASAVSQVAPKPPVVGATMGGTTPNPADVGSRTTGATDYRTVAQKSATTYGVPPDLFARLINQESGFDPTQVSGAGAVGIAQWEPGTAKGRGVDPHDPLSSLNGAAQYLAEMQKKYGSWKAALIGYNAGEGTVATWISSNGDDNVLPTETQAYIKDILGTYA